MDVTVDQAIENIWNCKSEEDFLDVTLTLLKLIQNVLFNPDKPKFKKIKRNTAVSSVRILEITRLKIDVIKILRGNMRSYHGV